MLLTWIAYAALVVSDDLSPPAAFKRHCEPGVSCECGLAHELPGFQSPTACMTECEKTGCTKFVVTRVGSQSTCMLYGGKFSKRVRQEFKAKKHMCFSHVKDDDTQLEFKAAVPWELAKLVRKGKEDNATAAAKSGVKRWIEGFSSQSTISHVSFYESKRHKRSVFNSSKNITFKFTIDNILPEEQNCLWALKHATGTVNDVVTEALAYLNGLPAGSVCKAPRECASGSCNWLRGNDNSPKVCCKHGSTAPKWIRGRYCVGMANEGDECHDNKTCKTGVCNGTCKKAIGCHKILDEETCMASVDGRKGTKYAGESCVWCCGDRCNKNKNKCEPLSFLNGLATWKGQYRKADGHTFSNCTRHPLEKRTIEKNCNGRTFAISERRIPRPASRRSATPLGAVAGDSGSGAVAPRPRKVAPVSRSGAVEPRPPKVAPVAVQKFRATKVTMTKNAPHLLTKSSREPDAEIVEMHAAENDAASHEDVAQVAGSNIAVVATFSSIAILALIGVVLYMKPWRCGGDDKDDDNGSACEGASQHGTDASAISCATSPPAPTHRAALRSALRSQPPRSQSSKDEPVNSKCTQDWLSPRKKDALTPARVPRS